MAMRGLLCRGVPSTLPKWLLFLKIAIMFLALVVLALSAYAISVFSSYGYNYAGTGAPGLLIFVAVKTLIVYGVMTAVQVWAPHMFFRIAAVVAYGLGIIFWLSSWAWAASASGAFFSAAGTYANNIYVDYGYGDISDRLKAEGGALAGAAAVGAIAWILSIVNLVFFIRACLNDPDSEGPNTTQQAELGQVPSKAQEAQYQANYQQQPPYQQQPMQPQPVYGQPQPGYGQPVQYQQQQQQPYATQ